MNRFKIMFCKERFVMLHSNLTISFVILLAICKAIGQEKAFKFQLKSETAVSVLMPSQALSTAVTEDAVVMTRIKSQNTVEVALVDFQGNIKKLLGEIQTSRPDRVFISSTPTRVIVNYQEMDPQQKIAKVYDLESNQVSVLRHEGGRVAFPVASPVDGKILYQLRVEGEPAKIYMTDSNCQNPKYIADGIGQSWLPDGKGYILKSSNVNPVVAYRHGKISGDEAQQEIESRRRGTHTREVRYWLFHEELSAPQIIPDLKDPNAQIVFSPQGRLLAVFDNGGLYQRSFSISEGKISFSDKQIIDETNAVYEIDRISTWDPSGEKLAYTCLYLDKSGHSNVNSDIYIYDLSARKTSALTTTPEVFEENPVWIQSGIIIIHKRVNHRKEGSVVKFNIQ